MLDAGSTLFERLDAALLRTWKLRCEDFERHPGDPAADPPITVVHIEIHIVGREMVVPRSIVAVNGMARCRIIHSQTATQFFCWLSFGYHNDRFATAEA